MSAACGHIERKHQGRPLVSAPEAFHFFSDYFFAKKEISGWISLLTPLIHWKFPTNVTDKSGNHVKLMLLDEEEYIQGERSWSLQAEGGSRTRRWLDPGALHSVRKGG